MARITTTITTGLLLRVASNETINDCIQNKQIVFSCPANWIDYGLKNSKTIGDIFECVFARLKKGDKRINNICDIYGNPMGDNLLVMENEMGDDCLLRLMPTILLPATCFYTFNFKSIFEKIDVSSEKDAVRFNLTKYCTAMDYQLEEASFLIIVNPEMFIEELRHQIPIAVNLNSSNLSSASFYGDFRDDAPLLVKEVNYNKHNQDEFFLDDNNWYNSICWKLPEYEYQSEARIVIPNINFIQKYNQNSAYDYKTNQLVVSLPNIDKYAISYPASKAQSLQFKKKDDEHFDFSVFGKV